MRPPKIATFLNITVFLKSFFNFWENSYTKFAILDNKFRFTCGELELEMCKNVVKLQSIMTKSSLYLINFVSVVFL